MLGSLQQDSSMNDNITIVCGTISNQGDRIQLYQTDSIQHLHILKDHYQQAYPTKLWC